MLMKCQEWIVGWMNEIFQSGEINHEEEPIPQRNKAVDSNSLISRSSTFFILRRPLCQNLFNGDMELEQREKSHSVEHLFASTSGLRAVECLCSREPSSQHSSSAGHSTGPLEVKTEQASPSAFGYGTHWNVVLALTRARDSSYSTFP